MKVSKMIFCNLSAIAFIGLAISVNAQKTSILFGHIKHTAQIQYFDEASSSLRGQYHFDSSKYFLEIYLLAGRCSFDKKDKELQLEAFVWIISGTSKDQNADTTALENFEVFLATPINGILKEKRIIASNCKRLQENNGFNIKVRLKENDRLYITNCSTDLLQEWEVNSLLK